jgi:hypothetical protein
MHLGSSAKAQKAFKFFICFEPNLRGVALNAFELLYLHPEIFLTLSTFFRLAV